MVKLRQREKFQFAPDYLKANTLWRIVDVRAAKIVERFHDLVCFGANWTEKCDD